MKQPKTVVRREFIHAPFLKGHDVNITITSTITEDQTDAQREDVEPPLLDALDYVPRPYPPFGQRDPRDPDIKRPLQFPWRDFQGHGRY